VVVWLTAAWYGVVLEALPDGARVLDVGVGTAAALVRHAALVRRKRLRIVGVDIDAAYIERAHAHIRRARLGDHVQARAAARNAWGHGNAARGPLVGMGR
jgi:ubiquinone/menaquinone biosynthesis C-methylase UbiE